MRLKVLYFAAARELVGASEQQVELGEGATTAALLEHLLRAHPGLGELMRACVLSVCVCVNVHAPCARAWCACVCVVCVSVWSASERASHKRAHGAAARKLQIKKCPSHNAAKWGQARYKATAVEKDKRAGRGRCARVLRRCVERARAQKNTRARSCSGFAASTTTTCCCCLYNDSETR